MIWNDTGFKGAYRARLAQAHSSSDAEARAQAQAFEAEAAKAGGSTSEIFVRRAGAAATATLSGYIKDALDAFDCAITEREAELEESDLSALRESLEQEIARRAKALPAALLDFHRRTAHPAELRIILQQAPVKARQLLAERVTSARDRIRTQVRAQALLDRAIVISHDAGDALVAGALKVAILEAVGSDTPVYTSSELEGIRSGRDGFERVLALLKKSRMTLAIVTPQSIENAWLWWTAGVAAGVLKPVFFLRAQGVGPDRGLPINPAQDLDLARRDDVVRLLQAIQGEMRRRPKDPSELDLEDVLRVAECSLVR